MSGERVLSPKYISTHADMDDFLASSKPIRIVKCSKGKYYEVRETDFATVSVEISARDELEGIKSNIKWEEGIKRKLPKIPKYLLWEIYQRFKKVCPSELLVNICYNEESKKYYLVEPPQDTAISSVSYQKIDDVINDIGDVVVMEMHSHGKANAYFSQTDDEDELATGFYGVMGKVNTSSPELKIRYSCGGQYREIDYRRVFSANKKIKTRHE